MTQTAVITGANRGLGFATARALAELGYRVVVTARDLAKAEDAAGQLTRDGLQAFGASLDVSIDQSVNAFFDWLDERGLGIDVLINNAGAIFERQHADRWDVGVLEVPADVAATAFDTNTLGAYRMMMRALPRMNEAGFGRIVNVSSGMGALHEMGGGYPAYRMSKAALNAATRIFALEASGDVKVNAVCPGWVQTDMGGDHATRTIEEGIAGIVWAATLPGDGPTNGFFRDGRPIAW